MPPKKGDKEAAKKAAAEAAANEIAAAAAAAAEARAKVKAEQEAAEAKRRERERKAAVDLSHLQRFLFPPNLEHPESAGRLELFACFGPVDSEGKLRGGIQGRHVCTDSEIRQMISHETREALFAMFNRPRPTVEVVVDELLPLALAEVYTWSEVLELLKDIPTDDEGKMNFSRIQKAVLRNQRQRLQELLRNGSSVRQRRPQPPFQSPGAEILTAIVRRKKHNEQEEELTRTKRLGNIGSLVAGLEHQNDARNIFANVTLVRSSGDSQDKWDRYCSVRKSGKSSHVKARNTPRFHAQAGDDCVADRHEGCSSLVSALLSAR